MKKLTSIALVIILMGAAAMFMMPSAANAGTGNISGYCYFDDNGNKIMDTSEQGIENIQISLNRLFLLFIPIQIQTAQTDTDGKYNFSGLKKGFYFIKATSNKDDETSTQNIIKATNVKLIRVKNRIVNFEFKRLFMPVSVSISAAPETIFKGEHSVLSWTSNNAEEVSIDGIGDVAAEGSRIITPDETSLYTITATGRNNAVAQDSVTVTVDVQASPIPRQLPSLTFTADPLVIAYGNSSTLKWTSAGALEAHIDQGIGSVELCGEMVVSPANTTTYTMTVIGDDGVAESSELTITVTHSRSGYSSSPDKGFDNSTNPDDGDDNNTNPDDEEIITAILLVSFEAEPSNGEVNLAWETGDESENFCFNIYRSEDENKGYVKINASI